MNDIKKVNYYLEPGYIYFSRSDVSVRTVLGSCVSICLWDKILKCGGINHYIFPFINDPKKATAKYGNAAIPALINIMERSGCQTKDLVAHIIGGACQENVTESMNIGKKNVLIAQKILNERNIKVISTDVGGFMGRKIVFDVFTGHIAVLKVHKTRQTDWIKAV